MYKLRAKTMYKLSACKKKKKNLKIKLKGVINDPSYSSIKVSLMIPYIQV